MDISSPKLSQVSSPPLYPSFQPFSMLSFFSFVLSVLHLLLFSTSSHSFTDIGPPPNPIGASYAPMSNYSSTAGIIQPVAGSTLAPGQPFMIAYSLPTPNLSSCEWLYLSLRSTTVASFADPDQFKWDIAWQFSPGYNPQTGNFTPTNVSVEGSSAQFMFTIDENSWNRPAGAFWMTIAARYYDPDSRDYILLAANEVWVTASRNSSVFNNQAQSGAEKVAPCRWCAVALASSVVLSIAFASGDPRSALVVPSYIFQ